MTGNTLRPDERPIEAAYGVTEKVLERFGSNLAMSLVQEGDYTLTTVDGGEYKYRKASMVGQLDQAKWVELEMKPKGKSKEIPTASVRLEAIAHVSGVSLAVEEKAEPKPEDDAPPENLSSAPPPDDANDGD